MDVEFKKMTQKTKSFVVKIKVVEILTICSNSPSK